MQGKWKKIWACSYALNLKFEIWNSTIQYYSSYFSATKQFFTSSEYYPKMMKKEFKWMKPHTILIAETHIYKQKQEKEGNPKENRVHEPDPSVKTSVFLPTTTQAEK